MTLSNKISLLKQASSFVTTRGYISKKEASLGHLIFKKNRNDVKRKIVKGIMKDLKIDSL